MEINICPPPPHAAHQQTTRFLGQLEPTHVVLHVLADDVERDVGGAEKRAHLEVLARGYGRVSEVRRLLVGNPDVAFHHSKETSVGDRLQNFLLGDGSLRCRELPGVAEGF